MLNQIVLVGRLKETPEIMKNQDGSKFTIITLAVPRSFKNADGEYETDFIDCVLHGKLADNTLEYCKKGDTIGINGRVEKLDNTKPLQIVAEKVSFLAQAK